MSYNHVHHKYPLYKPVSIMKCLMQRKQTLLILHVFFANFSALRFAFIVISIIRTYLKGKMLFDWISTI